MQNVTEWAKKKECWESVEHVQIPLSAELLGTLVGRETRATAKKDARAVQKIDDGIDAQLKVLKMPASTWTAATDFGTKRRILSPKDLGVIQVVSNGGVPTERQSLYLLNLIQRLTDAGFNLSDAAG